MLCNKPITVPPDTLMGVIEEIDHTVITTGNETLTVYDQGGHFMEEVSIIEEHAHTADLMTPRKDENLNQLNLKTPKGFDMEFTTRT